MWVIQLWTLMDKFIVDLCFIPFEYIPKNRIDVSYGSSITFWGTARLFSKVAVPFSFPLYEGSSFSTSLKTLVIICLFLYPSYWVRSGMIVVLIYISLVTNDLSVFSCACKLFNIFGECLFRNSFAQFLIELFVFFYYWVVGEFFI